ncbi:MULTISPECIES: homocysteine S-methyltransferase family protein [Sorangium]|uniref:Homocysteine S-methyltransferase n=1 Tax=Sorangium cellulosum TaxID=56 RepID=A0A4P2QH96_SORCE|nr:MULTISPECIES: homocysteine S-methyltransferase family protein [Sorangium]AUX28683.1 homocysteine S-methyltransferase [Sorangium cellulosum]WCQ88080.1 Homocysteine S-methyltransferase [Sorangium sp. Soce836]
MVDEQRARSRRVEGTAEADIVVLDGPLGTELAARGVETPAPLWSAAALLDARGCDVVRAIHRDYARAGATVHTANTFRTKRRQAGAAWAELLSRAVSLAREAVGEVDPRHRVAGSIAPLEDCYRPDLSPADARQEHRALAQALAAARVDVLLCETFPHVGEALVALEEAVATGVEAWVSFTAGPGADLLSPEDVGAAAREAAARGARAVLVNCTPATRTLEHVERLAACGVPFGAYANAGAEAEGLGWAEGQGRASAARYADLARGWIEAGATIVGGCCGTGPAHIAALRALADEAARRPAGPLR